MCETERFRTPSGGQRQPLIIRILRFNACSKNASTETGERVANTSAVVVPFLPTDQGRQTLPVKRTRDCCILFLLEKYRY